MTSWIVFFGFVFKLPCQSSILPSVFFVDGAPRTLVAKFESNQSQRVDGDAFKRSCVLATSLGIDGRVGA